MENCFELIEFNKSQINVVLVSFFNVITYFLKKSQINRYTKNKKYYGHKYFDDDDDYTKMAELPFLFNIFSSKIILVIIFLIIKYSKKNCYDLIIRDNKTIITNNINPNNKFQKITMIILILIILILEFVYRFESLNVYNKTNYIDMKLTIHFLVPFLSLFILKDKLHRHHIFSFFLISLSIIIICIRLKNFYSKIGEYYEKKTPFSDQMKHLSYSIFPALSSVLIKYLFKNYNISFFQFLMYDGILSFISPFIIFLMKSIIKGKKYFKKNINGFRFLFYNSKVKLLYIFGFITSSGYYLTKYLTLYYFSPNILVSFESFSLFLRWLIEFLFYDKRENKQKLILVVKFIGSLAIFISSLIYNEILILHIFNCDKNIEKRNNINRNMINYINSENVLYQENLNLMNGNNQKLN